MPIPHPLKRVLMICYAFPPVLASGTTRSVAFARNLPAFGWDPTVLTVDRCRDSSLATGEAVPAGIRIVRARELNLHGLIEFLHGATRRLVRLLGLDLKRNYYREFLCLPDAQIAWLSWRKGIRLARSHDVIYVSCSPFSAALVGCLLKMATGRPLVVDFRDAWSLNPHVKSTQARLAAIRFLERLVLGTCDRLIVNTCGAEVLYKRQYPQWREKIVTIPNGYDALNLAPARPATGKFTIMHVGSFYGSRGPDALLGALSDIADASMEFVQVGARCDDLKKYTAVSTRVVASIPHEEALTMMRTASLLYLKQGFEEGVTDYIAVAAKTYEYLATGLPILADCPDGDNADLVRRYCAHPHVVTSRSQRDLQAAVLQARAESETVVPQVTEGFVATFDRVRLTGQLADLFDAVA